MHALAVQRFAASQFKKRPNDVRTDLGSARIAGDSEAISSAGYVDVEAAFYLPQVLIKLAAKIGQAVIIGGFQDDVLRYLHGIQCLDIRPLAKSSLAKSISAILSTLVQRFQAYIEGCTHGIPDFTNR